jgi:hypothetical protein
VSTHATQADEDLVGFQDSPVWALADFAMQFRPLAFDPLPDRGVEIPRLALREAIPPRLEGTALSDPGGIAENGRAGKF